MPSIYVSEKVKENLKKFIEKSRESPFFGSPKKLKNFNRAIEFLLIIALKYPLKTLERWANQTLISGEMPVEVYDNPEARAEYINKRLEEKEQ